jgi:3-methyladenine DNA glycosylase/8-oxoguanine DNA glycosylase
MTSSIEIDIAAFDLAATFHQQLVGKFDPTGSRNATSLLKVHRNAAGDVVVWRFSQTRTGMRIDVHGDDGRLLESIARQFPLADGADTFRPDHPLLQRLSRRHRGLRLLRFPWAFDIAAAMVLQQRVRWQVGYADFRRVAVRWGTHTPAGVAFPTSSQIAALSPAHIESLGIDPKRARALYLLAQADARHGFLQPDSEPTRATERMLAIRGIGPWTVGLTAGLAFGDPDAVPVGDLHIPSLVTSALAGEADGTDERMLELLAAYPGQRFRVIRLLLWGARRLLEPAAVSVRPEVVV